MFLLLRLPRATFSGAVSVVIYIFAVVSASASTSAIVSAAVAASVAFDTLCLCLSFRCWFCF